MIQTAMFDGDDTLSQEIRRLHAERDEGTYCRACEQHVKLYRRKLNSGMAATLVWLVKEQGSSSEYVEVARKAPRFTLRAKDFSVLQHWRLIECKPNDNPSTRNSGLWRATDFGIDFVFGRAMVNSHVRLYNNTHMGFAGPMIGIKNALGSKFNFAELMGGE